MASRAWTYSVAQEARADVEAPCLLGPKSCELLITRKAHTDEVTSLLGQTARSCLMASSPNFPRASLRIGLAMCPFIFLDFSVCVCGGNKGTPCTLSLKPKGRLEGDPLHLLLWQSEAPSAPQTPKQHPWPPSLLQQSNQLTVIC